MIFKTFLQIKTHIQCKTDTKIAVGYQHQHRTMYQAMKEIISKEGILGLWRGVSGGTLRGAIGSSAQLGAFTTTKKILIYNQVNWFTVSVNSEFIVFDKLITSDDFNGYTEYFSSA